MNDDLKYADADYWNTYWQGAGNAGAYTDGGVSHPAVGSWWVHFFGECLSDKRPLRMLDIATGNGAVVDVAGRDVATRTAIDDLRRHRTGRH